ncbi:MAG: D-sedoheptulose-7-phosphate isomerase [Ruminiclostridium sp.]
MKISTVKILDSLIESYPQLAECKTSVYDAAQTMIACYKKHGKLMICGNGGSATDSDHIVGELMKAFKLDRPIDYETKKKLAWLFPEDAERFSVTLQRSLPAISLTGHSALITAISNDVSGDMIFAQQVFGYGEKTDALIALSTSGDSVNIVNAVKAARLKGVTTIAMTGKSGGKLKPLCDFAIMVPETETYRIQELHLPVYHALCAMAENEFFGVEG